MFCDRATYTLLMNFKFLNNWKHPLKRFYQRTAFLWLYSHLRNSRMVLLLMENILNLQVFHLANRNLTNKCVTSFQNGKQEVSQIRNTGSIVVLSQPSSRMGEFSRYGLEKMAFSDNIEMFARRHLFYHRATYTLLSFSYLSITGNTLLKSFCHMEACL